MRTIKGECRDCTFLAQEWLYQLSECGQEQMVLDTYCRFSDVFKRLDGYCDAWESSG